MKTILNILKALLLLLLVGAAIIVLIMFIHDPRPQAVIQREERLNKDLLLLINRADPGSKLKLAEIQPESWSYVCVVMQMSSSRGSLPSSDYDSADHSASSDILTSDDHNGLVFYDVPTKTYVALFSPALFDLQSQIIGSPSNCLLRDAAYVGIAANKGGHAYLKLMGSGDR